MLRYASLSSVAGLISSLRCCGIYILLASCSFSNRDWLVFSRHTVFYSQLSRLKVFPNGIVSCWSITSILPWVLSSYQKTVHCNFFDDVIKTFGVWYKIAHASYYKLLKFLLSLHNKSLGVSESLLCYGCRSDFKRLLVLSCGSLWRKGYCCSWLYVNYGGQHWAINPVC